MTAVTILCLIYMLALTGGIAFWLARCSRKDRLKRLKSFKLGKFVLIYFAAIPLFFLAERFNGHAIEEAVWLAICACFDVVKLSFDYTVVAPLAAESMLFHVTADLLFCLVVLNAIMFTLSFCGQWLFNRISLLRAKRSKKMVVVIGESGSIPSLLHSVPKGYRAILAGELTPALKDEAFLSGAAYCGLPAENDPALALKKLFKDFSRRKVAVIMDLRDDERTALCVKNLCTLIEEAQLKRFPLDEDVGLGVYVFTERENADIFTRYAESSGGIIRFINRHKQIAMNFVDDYPMTQFMTERELDYSTATVREGIALNVLLIGFGRLNESLFLTSVSNNQFLTLKDGRLIPKPVTYHIYDRYYPEGKFTSEARVHSGSLHHGYLRYESFLNAVGGHEKDYLELIPMPARTVKHPLEVTHPDFYASVRDVLRNENAYSYIVVSFGTDMENIELAEKLRQKLGEWGVTAPVKIFVKVRDRSAAESLNGDLGGLILFGSDSSCVYNTEVILHEKSERMARLMHLFYTAVGEIGDGHIKNDDAVLQSGKIRELARASWYGYKQFQRESNTYACLSARMKLQLCGYDIGEGGEDRTEEFLKKYQENDPRIPSGLTVAGKPVWAYPNDKQFRTSLRWRLVVQEHQRWCANMIANGLIPADREELAKNKKELFPMRKHKNITTMEGLVEYRKIMANTFKTSEEKEDVIRYDYQIMDDIDWLLKQCNLTIVKKERTD